MIPRHKVFHIVFFIVALNFLFGCPGAIALTGDTLHLSCSVSSHADSKKNYCQTQHKQKSGTSYALNVQYTLFSPSAPNRPCFGAPFPFVTIPTPFENSMRLNL